jgi:hypothetical protein
MDCLIINFDTQVIFYSGSMHRFTIEESELSMDLHLSVVRIYSHVCSRFYMLCVLSNHIFFISLMTSLLGSVQQYVSLCG